MPQIFIIDTSALIWFKDELPDTITELLEKLARLVSASILTFPRQVRTELDPHDDDLKEWARRTWRDAERHDVDRQIAAEVIPQIEAVIDHEKPGECADPWLVAQAVEFERKQPDVAVAVISNDYVKRKRESVKWACEQYGIQHVRPAEFLVQVDGLVENVREHTLFDPDELS